MRIVDFVVYYIMANIKRRKLGTFMWGTELGRAVFPASLLVTFNLFTIAEIIGYVFFKVNILDIYYSEAFLILAGFAIAQLLGYIYKNKRYKYITSAQYRSFTLSANLGVFIGFLMVFTSFIVTIGAGLLFNHLLTK